MRIGQIFRELMFNTISWVDFYLTYIKKNLFVIGTHPPHLTTQAQQQPFKFIQSWRYTNKKNSILQSSHAGYINYNYVCMLYVRSLNAHESKSAKAVVSGKLDRTIKAKTGIWAPIENAFYFMRMLLDSRQAAME